MQPKQTVPVRSVRKALELLEAVVFRGPSPEGVTLTELARQMGMLPNSTRNLLKTLVVCGFVAQTPDSRYVPGPKCLQLGRATRLVSDEAVRQVRALLVDLTARIGEATVFTTLSGANRVLVALVDSDQTVKIDQAVIQEGSIYGMPTGRVLVAHATADELQGIVDRHGLPGDAWDGLRSRAALDRALAAVRQAGVYVVHQGDMTAMACPALDAKGDLIGSLGCYLPRFRYTADKQGRIFREMRKVAATLGARWAQDIH